MEDELLKINRSELLKSQRIILGDWTEEPMQQLEKAIQELETQTKIKAIQKGRVIALRSTDSNRIFSAFKSAAYLGKYDDMQNKQRFLSKMVKSHHSYEPIRGESILFLFVGVGKPSYDHIITHSTGRYARIAGGQRANLPWGLEIAVETKDKAGYVDRNWQRVVDVINIVGKGDEEPEVKEQLQAARSELPIGYIMPPFLYEFSEEALAKTLFRQRLWEQGAQGATVEVVKDMLDCCLEIDREKWETLIDYHGSHTISWEKAMRTLRDKRYTFDDLCKMSFENEDYRSDSEIPLYDVIMGTVGKLPQTMWDKIK